jgi:hypothetical protein
MQRRKWRFRGSLAKSNLEMLLEKNARSVERYHSSPFSDFLILSPKEKVRFERLFDRHLVVRAVLSTSIVAEIS